jgi:iron transport multicopper oxidase
VLAFNQPPPSSLSIDADPGRTGWYPNQPQLDPGIVTSSDFGRIFETALTLSPGEQVFAQPLVLGNAVFVVTEANDAYTLDPQSGAVTESRNLGAPWNANDIGCGDLVPSIGITGTPAIDTTSRTAFFFSKSYRDGTQGPDRSNAVWYAHALDVDTLDERPNFPVEIQGAASNDPSVVFDPFSQMQRTGLLLMDGVVYAGFGGHCDFDDYHGWVVGIGESGDVRALFATEAGPGSVRGAGIWQSGGGLMSDGSGRIFLTTGNGYSNSIVTPTQGTSPPPALDESVVRLSVQADGTLSAGDFFTPYDVAYLDSADLDFGSGAVVALPDDGFGTTSHPHLALAAGKEGVMYLLDRDSLGGFKQGIGGGDGAVSQVVVEGGLWSRPGVWSGNGGMAYVVPANEPLQSFQYGPGSDGVPAFTFTGSSTEALGFSSGSPIITSNGTRAGSALVWVTYATGAFGSGSLRAYDAVPDASGNLTLRFDDAYGAQAKFSRPAVGAGRIYVGTADGHVLGYGTPLRGPLMARAVDFGTVVAGNKSQSNVVIRARASTTVQSISSTNTAFTVTATSPALPAQLDVGQTLTVSTSFAPSNAQPYVAALSVKTDAGAASVSLHGIGQNRGPLLSVAASGLSLGGLPVNGSRSTNVLVRNTGSQALTFSEVDVPRAPFSVSGAPLVGSSLAPGESTMLMVTFAPTTDGTFGDSVALLSNGGSAMVMLSGTSSYSGQLDIEPVSLDFGQVAPGQTSTASFTIHNVGNTAVTITKSKPPSLGTFVATNALDEGTVLEAGASVVEIVSFAPATAGTYADEWIIGASDGGGSRGIAFGGTAGQ